LQSWGEHSHFNERDTAAFPTRSGVIGLLAAALGRERGAAVDDLAAVSLTVRIDRPGVLLRDLHTVGGGLPAKATVTTAEGKKRPGDTGTLLTHRMYLADAVFTAAVAFPDDLDDPDHPDHPDHPDRLDRPDAPGGLARECARALVEPRWPLFLGRRSCPPEGPLLLAHTADTLAHLVALPLAAPPRNAPASAVEFVSDRPLDRLPVPPIPEASDERDGGGAAGSEFHGGPRDHDDGSRPVGEITDDPVSFHPRSRSYRARPLYRRRALLSAQPTLGAEHLDALHSYLIAHRLAPFGDALEGSR
jgi:CRISPR system Cascade subunit CasD